MLADSPSAPNNERPPPPVLPPIPQWSARQAFQGTLVVCAVLLGCWLLIHYRSVFFSLFIAIVISTAMTPLVDWFFRRGMARAGGVLLIYFALFSVLALALWLYAPVVIDQIFSLTVTLGETYSNVRRTLLDSSNLFVVRLARELPAQLNLTSSAALAPGDVLTQAWNYGELISRNLFLLVAILLLAFYWTLERERTLRTALLLLPRDRRESAREIFEAVEGKIGAYVRGLALLSLSVAVMAFVAYVLIGVPNALLLALAAGLFEAIPLVGPTLGAIPAVMVALAIAPDKVVWVIAVNVVIQMAENSLLVPKVMDRAVGINPVVGLLAFAAFSALFGFAGALLAIPLAALGQILFERFVFGPQAPSPERVPGRDPLSVLRYETRELVQDVRKHVRQKDEPLDAPTDEIEDGIEAIANDLDSLLAQVSATEETNGAAANGEKPP